MLRSGVWWARGWMSGWVRLTAEGVEFPEMPEEVTEGQMGITSGASDDACTEEVPAGVA